MPKSTEETNETRGRFSTVTKHLRHYRGYLIVGGICIILTNGLALIVPYITKIIFDLLENQGTDDERLKWVLIMFGLALLSGVFRFLQRRTVIWASRKIEYRLRSELFDHLLKLSPSYYDNTRTGDIMARMTSDLEAVRMMVGPGIMHMASTAVVFVIAISFMVHLSLELTLYSLAPMVILPIAVNRLGNLVHQRATRIQNHFSALTATVQENIAGMRVVKAFRQEGEEVGNFDGMSLRYFDLNMDMARVNAMFSPVMMSMAALLTLTVLYFGGVQVMDGTIPLGTLVAFFAYLSMLFWPAIAVGWVVSIYQRGKASLDRINKILWTEPIIENGNGDRHQEPMQGHIEFRNLRFKYETDYVLDGIDLTIEPGQTIGLIGMTGSGKSTLVSLLSRMYPVERGQLLIDGVDVNDWDLMTLRRQIGFATQEPFLFSDSVAENIRFGNGGVEKDAIREAARTAALSKDIESFPDDYDTMVGERGITLSGGQKQRTAIARAIMVQPSVLILDDATSSVDTQTEDEINESIKSVLKGRTSIIISHRVSSVKEADLIVYLENGRIAEKGTHDELISLGGNYAELYRAQLLAMELEKL